MKGAFMQLLGGGEQGNSCYVNQTGPELGMPVCWHYGQVPARTVQMSTLSPTYPSTQFPRAFFLMQPKLTGPLLLQPFVPPYLGTVKAVSLYSFVLEAPLCPGPQQAPPSLPSAPPLLAALLVTVICGHFPWTGPKELGQAFLAPSFSPNLHHNKEVGLLDYAPLGA